MFSGVGNLRHTYDLHQAFFSSSLDDMSLDDFYNKFRGICEEMHLSEPIFADVVAMKQQHESMRAAHFLSALSSSFDGAPSQRGV